jgi:hypothetical protein
LSLKITKEFGAGDGNRTRTTSLGIVFIALYFHNLQNDSEKINVHATHTVHAVPDLRVAAGRLRDDLTIQDFWHLQEPQARRIPTSSSSCVKGPPLSDGNT